MTPDEARVALASRPVRPGGPRLPRTPEQRAARAKAASLAQSRAKTTLVALHKDEYDALYGVALADLLSESGQS